MHKGLAILLLIVFSPFFLLIWFLINREDQGGAMFYQRRVGKEGRVFYCAKFRTMRMDAEEMLARWEQDNTLEWQEYKNSNNKLKNDPRVTSVGKFLRKTSLDELPQLINIAFGDMYFIGPRPLLESEIAEYGEDRFKVYCSMTPGITGLWQVSGRSNTTFEERAILDCEYAKTRSVWLDFVILLKTVKVVLFRDGAY